MAGTKTYSNAPKRRRLLQDTYRQQQNDENESDGDADMENDAEASDAPESLTSRNEKPDGLQSDVNKHTKVGRFEP